MGIGIMVVVLLTTVFGTAYIEITRIKGISNSAKNSLISGMTTKVIEAATGTNVKSLVDKKGFINNDGTSSMGLATKIAGKVSNAIPKSIKTGASVVTGLGMVGAGATRTAFELLGKTETGKKVSEFTKFYSTLGKEKMKHYTRKISGFTKFYSTLGKEKVKHFTRKLNEGRLESERLLGIDKVKNYMKQTKDDIKQTAGLYGDAFKKLGGDISGAITDTKGWDMQTEGMRRIANAFGIRHPGLALRRPSVDPLASANPVNLRGTQGTSSQIRELTSGNNSLEEDKDALRRSKYSQEKIDKWMASDIKDEYMKGLQLYKSIKGGPKNAKNYAEYKKNANEFAEALYEINHKTFAPEDAEIASRMLVDVTKSSSGNLDKKGYIQKTIEGVGKYSNLSATKAIENARNEAMRENSKMKPEEIEDLLTDPAHSKIYEDAFDNIMKDGGKNADKYFKEITTRIANNDKSAITAYLGKEGQEDIQNRLNARIERAVLQKKSEIVSKFEKEGMTFEQAMEHVDNLENGKIDEKAYQQALEATMNMGNAQTTKQTSKQQTPPAQQVEIPVNAENSELMYMGYDMEAIAAQQSAQQSAQQVSQQAPQQAPRSSARKQQQPVNVDNSELVYMGYDVEPEKAQQSAQQVSQPTQQSAQQVSQPAPQSSARKQQQVEIPVNAENSELTYMGYDVETAARSAAETAARSAAETAARSAAETAARSAAETAARSAAETAAETAARSAAETVARSNTESTVVKEVIKEKEVGNSTENTTINNLNGLNEVDVARISSEVTRQALSPISEYMNKANKWLENLGRGNLEDGARKFADTIDKLADGSLINVTKSMEKQLKDLGGGDVTRGAKEAKLAIENINKGNGEEIAKAIAELMAKKSTSDTSTASSNGKAKIISGEQRFNTKRALQGTNTDSDSDIAQMNPYEDAG